MIYTLLRKEGEEITTLISFDAITSVEEKWSAKVTSQTVESGFDISDSITVDPPTFNLSGVVTSYSIYDTSSEISWNGTDFVIKNNPQDERHISLRNDILEIISKGVVITLVESLETSSNPNKKIAYEETVAGWNREIPYCVITSASFSPPDSGFGAFNVSLELQRVFIASVVTDELHPNDVAPVVVPYYSEATSSSGSGDSKGSAKDKKDGEDMGPTDIAAVGEYNNGPEKVQKTPALIAAEKQHTTVMTGIRSKIAALQAARDMTIATGIPHSVVQAGDAWSIQRSSYVNNAEKQANSWANETSVFN